jgi:hypothetical protein
MGTFIVTTSIGLMFAMASMALNKQDNRRSLAWIAIGQLSPFESGWTNSLSRSMTANVTWLDLLACPNKKAVASW